MTRYDHLDPRKELEQTIAEDLRRALEKRGFAVQHNGMGDSNAPSEKSDLEVYDSSVHLNIEVTQTTKSSADREFLSIKDHLEKTKRDYSRQRCFVIYASPETHYRMINAMRDYNIMHKDDEDLKMIPLCFSTLEYIVDRLVTTPKEVYPKGQLLTIFDSYRQYVDDETILSTLSHTIFSGDIVLRKESETQEENRHQRTVEELIRALLTLEDSLRENKGITHIDAIRNIIFLVFIKLYEEKREFENKDNRFKVDTFTKYQEFVGQEAQKRAIHLLFDGIKKDPELKSAQVFTDTDNLADKLDDDFVLKFFIEPFEKYHFYTTKVDGIGAAYEVLGLRTGKDVKAGQFFTPENVVTFMTRLAELEPDDTVLDPACGTARFLVRAMYDMMKKVEGRNKEEKVRTIRTRQLYGTDYDLNVAKLAKMNMYIHGDGKTNIFAKDGLLLYDMDNTIDCILTNPPLGDQSYRKDDYDEKFRTERMEVIPKKNITAEKLEKTRQKLADLRKELEALGTEPDPTKTKSLAKSISLREERVRKLEFELQSGKPCWLTTGNQMKGGALFVGAARHYLKAIRNRDLPVEWRGGKLLIVLDEGILNTSDYAPVRQIIRKYFYIKAIVSLTRDTFVSVSSTTTKTSILYAIKKEDPDAAQQEPVFFSYAEKVGVDTRKRICQNHLFNDGESILEKYFEFKKAVLASYIGPVFSREMFAKQGFRAGVINV